ncbi:MAG TPA: transglutaminase-like domain-containing protein [Chthonomonadales bacterium]|nr:transglutaminase-like domain-containing protein [Chthonomonadales bacterium]
MNSIRRYFARPGLHRDALRFTLTVAGALLALSLAASCSFAQQPPPAQTQSAAAAAPQQLWMSIYWNGQKVGYTNMKTAPATFKGAQATITTSRSVMKLTMLGANLQTEENSRTFSDAAGKPLSQTFEIKSNGSANHVAAEFDYAKNQISCVVGVGSSATHLSIKIPPGADLAADAEFSAEGRKPSLGEKRSFLYLDPITVQLESASSEVTSRANVRDAVTGKQISAYVLKTAMPEGEVTEWESENGDLVKAEMSMGMIRFTMIAEPEKSATSSAPSTASPGSGASYTPPQDFAVATAIVANRQIAAPRAARSMNAVITGVPDRRFILSDSRQEEKVLAGPRGDRGYTVEVSVKDQPFPEVDSARLPINDPSLTPFLHSAPYLHTEDSDIRGIAARLRGSQTNLYRIAVSIRDWVHRHMTPDAGIGVPRSATDIVHRRRGVCRDYAILYTAIARAAGVPTRLCSGIVYARGRFYYHAWAESYVGRWVAIDPTLYDPDQPVEYVDATHIKFAEGDALSMFKVVSIVGRLNVKITGVTG